MDRTLRSGSGDGRFSPWLAALLGIVTVKAILSLSMGSLPFAYSYSGISYFLLLLLATGFSIRNGMRRTLGARPFWLLLAAGCGMWAIHQSLNLYYQLGLHIDVPDNSITDDVLFLHLAPLMAAVATLPNLPAQRGKQHRWILNSLLILGLWTFLYGFVVAPYKYFAYSPDSYGARFDVLYLIENAALVLMVGVVAMRARAPWRGIYVHLLGAALLYALSSAVANFAVDAGGYVNGKLYGFGLTVSVCWFVWIPLSVREARKTETSAMRLADQRDSQVAGWAMLSVVLIAVPMAWELFHRGENASVRTVRLVVAMAAIVVLAGGAFLNQYFDNREAALERQRAEDALRASEERFRLAAQAGRAYAVEWDVATGAIVRSGDVASVIGIKEEDLGRTLQEYLPRIHPDDRALVTSTLHERVPESPSSQIRHRLVRTDGSIVWVERTIHAFFNAQGAMVRAVGMVTNITERKQAEDALRESEEKFRSVFRDAGVGMVIVSPDGRFLAANATFCEYLGYTEAEILTRTVESVTVPEDWPGFSLKLSEALQAGRDLRRAEKRCLHKSGRMVSTETSAALIRDSEGVPQYFVGEVIDITARKESEEALATFNRRLIQAQEAERTRIARELHDDISQRVAILAIRLGQLKAARAGMPEEMLNQFSKTQEETAELSLSIQHLSHELHSSTLKLVGLTAAIRSWCGEFAENRQLEIKFESHDVPARLPAEISLHLYRVLQEALNNAAKYSGAKRFEVLLWGTGDEVHLSVKDAGKGFDIHAAMKGRGLGLKSMRERVKLVGGHLAIDSKVKQGTTVMRACRWKRTGEARDQRSENRDQRSGLREQRSSIPHPTASLIRRRGRRWGLCGRPSRRDRGRRRASR